MFTRHSRYEVTSRLRLRGHDYSTPGAYFVTLCTERSACLFVGACSNTGGRDPLPQLSAIIQWFKGMTTNDYMLGVKFQDWTRFPGRLWQRGYYDRIVRNDSELEKFRSYIEANSARWLSDEHCLHHMDE